MFTKEEIAKHECQLKKIASEISEKEVTETLNFLYALGVIAYDGYVTNSTIKQLNINYYEKRETS